MKKKELLQLPLPTFTKEDLSPKSSNKIDWYYDARLELDGKLLSMTLFDPNTQQASWRIFHEGEKWLNYNIEKQRWTTGRLEYIGMTPRERWRSAWFLPITKAAEKAGQEWCGEDGSTDEILLRHQRYWAEEQRAKTGRMKQERRESIFAQWQELPSCAITRLEDSVWKDSKYCFFHKAKKGGLHPGMERELGIEAPYIGECSACGSTFGLDHQPTHEPCEAEHPDEQELIECPHCHSILHPKKAHLGRKNLYKGDYLAVASERDGILYIDMLYVTRSYRCAPYRTKASPAARYYLDTVRNEARYWKFGGPWNQWQETRKPYLPFSFCEDGSVLESILKTRLRYGESVFSRMNSIRAACLLTEYPSVELLDKLGLEEWVNEFVLNTRYIKQAIHFRGKNLKEVLGMNKEELAAAKKLKVGAFGLLLFKKLRKEGKWMTQEQNRLSECISRKEEFLKLSGFTGVNQAFQYLIKQRKKHPGESVDDLILSWRDYLSECRELGYDLKDPYHLMPPDLMKAHNETMQRVSAKNNPKLDAQISKRLEKLRERYCFAEGEFLIRPAQSSGELTAEGAFLHHCVGRYAERYAEGKTDILLIRRRDEPELPLVTAEYRGGKRIQIKASRNQAPQDDVMAFVEKFETNLKRTKTSKSKEENAA